MENYLNGKVVIVTGAGSGFGRLIAQKVAKMGGKVVANARTESCINETAELVRAEGGEITVMRGDASKYEDVKALVDLAVEQYGALDVFIANAGVMPLAPWSLHETALPAWEGCIDTNLKGTAYAISACYDQMIKQGHGHFVSISSIFGNYPVVSAGVYQATKIGIRYMVNSLRQEARGKIKVSVVNPTGCPTTNLNSTVLDASGLEGICAQFLDEYVDFKERRDNGKLAPEESDPNSVRNWLITPEEVTDSIIYVINQPLGINIGEITVRATNEPYIL